jgi:hypothetical protein
MTTEFPWLSFPTFCVWKMENGRWKMEEVIDRRPSKHDRDRLH